jgi:hypothetical protein
MPKISYPFFRHFAFLLWINVHDKPLTMNILFGNFSFLAYFLYFKKIIGGLRDYLAVCPPLIV